MVIITIFVVSSLHLYQTYFSQVVVCSGQLRGRSKGNQKTEIYWLFVLNIATISPHIRTLTHTPLLIIIQFVMVFVLVSGKRILVHRSVLCIFMTLCVCALSGTLWWLDKKSGDGNVSVCIGTYIGRDWACGVGWWGRNQSGQSVNC